MPHVKHGPIFQSHQMKLNSLCMCCIHMSICLCVMADDLPNGNTYEVAYFSFDVKYWSVLFLRTSNTHTRECLTLAHYTEVSSYSRDSMMIFLCDLHHTTPCAAQSFDFFPKLRSLDRDQAIVFRDTALSSWHLYLFCNCSWSSGVLLFSLRTIVAHEKNSLLFDSMWLVWFSLYALEFKVYSLKCDKNGIVKFPQCWTFVVVVCTKGIITKHIVLSAFFPPSSSLPVDDGSEYMFTRTAHIQHRHWLTICTYGYPRIVSI